MKSKIKFDRNTTHKAATITTEGYDSLTIERNLETKELYINSHTLSKQDVSKLIGFLQEITK